MSAEATLPLAPGDQVAGKYEVDRVLGVGGMGAVFGARSLATGERVAIKCLLPVFCDNVDVITRFLREGRATMRLKSEHIARVSDTGALETGVPYIVMELLEGRDLRSVVKHDGPRSIVEAAVYGGQVCKALAEAHALGIVHRDLKPANLFLTQRPSGDDLIKVLDFGIAKYTSPSLLGDHVEMTKTQAVLGSRAYMSPEQMLRPKDVDARADIWSIGVILYYLVAGRNPFSSDTTEGMIMRIISGAPEPLSTLVPDVPASFEAIVMRCLSKAREHRFSNVTELARVLAAVARNPADRPTLTLDDGDDDERHLPGIPPPAPSGPTMRAFTLSDAAQAGGTETGTSQPGTSRTSVTRVTRRSLPPLLVALATLVGAAAVVGSFVIHTRHAAGHTEDDGAEAPIAVPAPVVVPLPPPITTVSAATVAMLDDDAHAVPPPASPAPIAVRPASIPISPARASVDAPRPVGSTPLFSIKPTLAKASGPKPGSKGKAAPPAPDSPW